MNLDFWSSFKDFIYEIYPPFWDAVVAFLGKYAVEVLSAYFASIILLVVIVVMSVRRSRRVRAQLTAVEARKDKS